MTPQPRVVSMLDAAPKKGRDFTAAERALMNKLHGFMPAQQLLDLLNERLQADMPGAKPYTMAQMHDAIGDAAKAMPEGGHDWASLRKLIASARRDGTLALISERVIDDFAVVFSLNPQQVTRLKDIVLSAREAS